VNDSTAEHAAAQGLALGEILDVEALRSLLDRFHDVIGVACTIIDGEGQVLASSGPPRVCLDFHRTHLHTRALCDHVHETLVETVPPGTHKLLQCPNGLWVAAAPIYVNGNHAGSLSLGAFFPEGARIDREWFESRGRQLGFSETQYLDALAQVPTRSRNTVEAALELFVEYTSLVSSLAQAQLDLSRALQDKVSQEQRLRSILRAAPTGIGVAVNRVIIGANQALCELLGYEDDELIGNSTRMLYPDQEEFEQVGKEHYPSIFTSGADVMETVFRRKDGTRIDVSLSSAVINPSNPASGVTFTVLDLTEQKRRERESRRRLQMEHVLSQAASHFAGVSPAGLDARIDEALSALGEAAGADRMYVFLIDYDGETTLSNTHEWCASDIEAEKHHLQNLPAAAFDWWMSFLEQDEPILITDVSALPKEATNERATLESQGIRSLAVVPMQYDNELIGFTGFDVVKTQRQWDHDDVGFLRTVAAILGNAIGRIRDSEQSRRLEGKLLEVERMESVGRLAGGVAHDFNNMLQTILGYADMALAETPEGTPVHGYLQEIEKAAGRSADLTRQLLAFARQQPIAPQTLDINERIRGVLSMLRHLTGEEIDLCFRPAGVPHEVNMDPAQIDQILTNLVVNARDAIAGTGRILIETGNVDFDADSIREHPESPPGSYVRLAVSDTGHGMDQTVLEQVFDPFFTTKRLGRGTGLGLSTVYGIATQNGGFVEAASTPGQGSTFTVYLPRAAADNRKERDSTTDPEPLPGGTERVLLVEDEKTILDLARRQLGNLGYDVVACDSPFKALDLAATNCRPIQLLITDVIMPGMDGRALAEQLSTCCPQMKCLFMSGYTADVIGHRGVLNEGVHFLEKPFTHTALAKKVREVLDGPD
jgi:PAS domain S-box-containing protein